MIYSKEVEEMCPVAKGVDHGPAPIHTVLVGVHHNKEHVN